MKRWKLAIPWLLAQFGVRKWLAERALHLPEEVVAKLAPLAGVTVEQWRAVEARLVDLLYDRIEVYVSQ